jgi:hypothetical protein
MSADELKALFNQPLMLLLLMGFASMGSASKQLTVSRRQGQSISLFDYFFRIETLIMLGTNVAVWLTLLYFDTLNIASALGGGYVSNDAADVVTKQGRSAAINPLGDNKT